MQVSSISPSLLQKKPAWVLPRSIRHEALPAEDTISCTKPSHHTLLASPTLCSHQLGAGTRRAPAGTGLGSSCQIPSGRLSKEPPCSRAEMHHTVNPPALGKQTAAEDGEEEAAGGGKHPWAAGSPNPSLPRCRQELKEVDETSRLLPLPNSSA